MLSQGPALPSQSRQETNLRSFGHCEGAGYAGVSPAPILNFCVTIHAKSRDSNDVLKICVFVDPFYPLCLYFTQPASTV